MIKDYDYGKVTFEGKEYALTSNAEFTNSLLPGPWNINNVSEGEEFQFEMSASAVNDEGEECTVYWIFWAIKGEERELDTYDYTKVDRVQF